MLEVFKRLPSSRYMAEVSKFWIVSHSKFMGILCDIIAVRNFNVLVNGIRKRNPMTQLLPSVLGRYYVSLYAHRFISLQLNSTIDYRLLAH